MPTATFNGVVIAESDQTVVIEGNHYFPPDALKQEYFRPVDRTTFCGWKGTANYYDVEVDGEVAEAAAWTYRDPEQRAEQIREHVAFYPQVRVEA